jgi:hypothetical protein
LRSGRGAGVIAMVVDVGRCGVGDVALAVVSSSESSRALGLDCGRDALVFIFALDFAFDRAADVVVGFVILLRFLSSIVGAESADVLERPV